MKTNLGKLFAALSMASLLALLGASATAAQSVDTPEIRAAAQNATTRSDHEAVAKYYDDAAKQMQAKVKEQKELLEQYENRGYLYGRQAQDLQSHTRALVREYEQTVTANIREAALHRKMVSKLGESHAASGTSGAVSGL